MLQNLEKEYKVRVKENADYEKRKAKEPNCLEALEQQIAALRS